ncbi:MAG: spore germination YkwD domain-containing protein [Acidimicrobiales bacterium]
MFDSPVGAKRTRADALWNRTLGRGLLLVGVTALVALPMTQAVPLLASSHAGAGVSAQALAPHTGIVPPKNPAKILAPLPNFISSATCLDGKETAACNVLVLTAITNARRVLEKIGGMSLNLAAYDKMSPVEQLFVTANLERTARGLAPATELTRSLDLVAQAGAVASRNPYVAPLGGRKLPGGGSVIRTAGTWSTGYDNALGADYGWMYQGTGLPSTQCRVVKPACWSRRDNILGVYATKTLCRGKTFQTVMGAGYRALGAVEETQVFAGVCGKAPTDPVLTWAKAQSLLRLPRPGILPPKNPAKSLPPSPNFIDSTTCFGGKDTAACNALILKAIASARKLLENMGPVSLNLAAYDKMSPVEQLFVTANLERTARGLAPATELTRSLDLVAQAGALAGGDPNVAPLAGKTLPGGGIVIQAGGNWATGYDNPLGSDYGWMYDDGPGGPNTECNLVASACWGHRDNILDTYATKKLCQGETFQTVMGAGYRAVGAVDGDGETQVFAGVCGKAPTDPVLTWAKAKSLLGIK